MAPARKFSHEDAPKRVASGESYTEVAKSLDVTIVAVLNVCRRSGIPYHSAKPGCELNHDFFANITTEHQAYFLGLLAADGCVTGQCVCLKLTESDSHIVEEFKKAVGSTHKLHTSKSMGYKGSPTIELKFRSTKMVSDLAKLGILPRKSFTAEAWDGPPELMRHYWRGVIDGDGWIGKEYPFQLGIIGSLPMVTSFTKYASEISGSSINPKPKKSVWTTVLNTTTAQKMARHLYEGSTVSLNRKRERAEHLMSQSFKSHSRAWESITREQIISLCQEYRDWNKVADILGVPLTSLKTLCNRKYKITKKDIPICRSNRSS